MIGCWSTSDVFGKDDGETRLQMPVNVAVKKPGASVIGDEADDDGLGPITGVNYIAARGRVEPRHDLSDALDDGE
jgi:hypothetical protein